MKIIRIDGVKARIHHFGESEPLPFNWSYHIKRVYEETAESFDRWVEGYARWVEGYAYFDRLIRGDRRERAAFLYGQWIVPNTANPVEYTSTGFQRTEQSERNEAVIREIRIPAPPPE